MTIATIRAMIQDKPLYARQVISLDGVQVDCQVEHFPVVTGSLLVTPDLSPVVTTLDEPTGVLSFDTAPDAGNITVSYKHVLLSDEDIQVYIDANPTEVKLAAADALDAMAVNQALILKKIKLLDLETDGPALAKELRAAAKNLRDQVFSDEFVESDFDIAEQINDFPGLREKVIKDRMREG